MPRLPHAATDRVIIRWEGWPVEARAGESVAAALYAAGNRTLARSRKFHRPRGLSGSFVAGVLARVDDVPNVRLDGTVVRDGLDVRTQNVWPNGRLDLLHLARLIPRRWLRVGFEHPRWLPSGTRAFDRWEGFLRFMAGGGDQPDARAAGAVLAGERLAADTVVVGGGPAGRAAAAHAASLGRSVVVVSRGPELGAFAAAMGVALPAVPPSARVLAGTEAFALYRGGTLVGCAPRDGGPAVLIDAKDVVLATGRRSVPPLVPNIDLPGVLDIHAALHLAQDCAVAPGARCVLIGTGDLEPFARRLRELGVIVAATAPAAALRRVVGVSSLRAVDIDDRRAGCDTLIHAGPWRPDPTLPFQAGADGAFRLASTGLPPRVTLAGDAALPPEPVVYGPALDDRALICPCMDVTVAEVRDLVARGETHVEVIKRLTGCGMGPCQGVPCWDLLAAALAALTQSPAESFGHPSYRPPRGALTLAQAAGLADLVTPDPGP